VATTPGHARKQGCHQIREFRENQVISFLIRGNQGRMSRISRRVSGNIRDFCLEIA